jgi:hypothetical protein
MKKTVAVIGLAIGLSLAGAGIANASAVAAPDRCEQARTALMQLEAKAAAEQNPAKKQALLRMVAGARPAVDSQCH